MQITDTISIPDSALRETFIRASGPGGQNVNKVASAVQLRFDLAGCEAIPAPIRARARRLAGSRLTKDGEIVITADTHRSQERNREEARKRLVALIRRAVPPPVRRKPRLVSRTAIRKRLDAKKRRGQTKALRRRPVEEG